MKPIEIPTHLGVEDRMLWFLTARQVTILLSGAALAYAAWGSLPWLPAAGRASLAALVGLLTLALALVRPWGRGLEEWTFVWLHYAAMPRVASWAVCEPARAYPDDGSGWERWGALERWPADGHTSLTAAGEGEVEL